MSELSARLIREECDAVKAMQAAKKAELSIVTRDCSIHLGGPVIRDGRCSACYQRIWVKHRKKIDAWKNDPSRRDLIPLVEQAIKDEKIAERKRNAPQVAREMRAKNAERERARDRRRNQNPARQHQARERALMSRYGLTMAEYDLLLESQGHVCAICRSPESGRNKAGKVMRWHVDHCHETGLVRGLLCSKCNTGLGLFGDSPSLMMRAMTYLMKRGAGAGLSPSERWARQMIWPEARNGQ